MAPNTNPLVLLTGATGHVGSTTLLRLCQDGYRVRAVLRSRDQITSLLTLPSLKNGSGLSFVVVPDNSRPGAYEEIMKDVTFVIHCKQESPGFPPPLRLWQEKRS
jgi:nucleoside-diphosphate-sugar epimerase